VLIYHITCPYDTGFHTPNNQRTNIKCQIPRALSASSGSARAVMSHSLPQKQLPPVHRGAYTGLGHRTRQAASQYALSVGLTNGSWIYKVRGPRRRFFSFYIAFVVAFAFSSPDQPPIHNALFNPHRVHPPPLCSPRRAFPCSAWKPQAPR